MADRRANQSQIWDTGLLVGHVWGTFDLIVFKVIWGHPADLRVFLKDDFSKRYTTYSFYFSSKPFLQFPMTVITKVTIEILKFHFFFLFFFFLKQVEIFLNTGLLWE